MDYKSEVEKGERYTDQITGVTGTATQICFNLDGTTQVMLEYGTNEGAAVSPKRSWFDDARLQPAHG